MASNLQVLKILVPAQRPAPPLAAGIGELAVALLSAMRAGGIALAAARRGGVRARLLQSAASSDAPSPATSHRLISLSMKAWDH